MIKKAKSLFRSGLIKITSYRFSFNSLLLAVILRHLVLIAESAEHRLNERLQLPGVLVVNSFSLVVDACVLKHQL